jgi:hypothetical protein
VKNFIPAAGILLLLLSQNLFAGKITDAGSYLGAHVVEATLSNGIHVQLLDKGIHADACHVCFVQCRLS